MISEQDAIARARCALGFGDAVGSRAWLVFRLDRPNDRYFLVELGGQNMSGAIVTVDGASGEVMQSARLPYVTQLKTPEEILGKGNVDLQAEIRLAWRPCDATRSPLYPLWEIRTKKSLFYLDQNGRRWDRLEITGRGG